MEELKKKVEAILFSVGRYISLEEITKLCQKDTEKVKDALRELQVDYENSKRSLIVINDGEMWKLTTREEYTNVVRKVVTETELTKSQIETLAVIAFKYPIKQSDLIKIRTNKAYDHISELEDLGFITRKKYGRSKLIKLTDKFFDYFDLPHEKLKERFKGFEQLANTIEKKEEIIEKAKSEQKKAAEEAKRQDEAERKIKEEKIEIDLVDDQGHKEELEIVDEPIKEVDTGEKLGDLDVVNEPKEESEERLGKLEVVDEPATEENAKNDDLEIVREPEEEYREAGNEEVEIDDIKGEKKK